MKRTQMVAELEGFLETYKGYKVEENTELAKTIVTSIYTSRYLVNKYKKDKRKNITSLAFGEVANTYMASIITVIELAFSSETGIDDLNKTIEKLLERY